MVKYDSENCILNIGKELGLLNLKTLQITKTDLNLEDINTGLLLKNNQIFCGSETLYHIGFMD
jgi:hypothetical protein